MIIDRIPTQAEIAARRARLGYVIAKPIYNPALKPESVPVVEGEPVEMVEPEGKPIPSGYAEPGAPLAELLRDLTCQSKRKKGEIVSERMLCGPAELVNEVNIFAVSERVRREIYTAAQTAIMTLEEVTDQTGLHRVKMRVIANKVCSTLGISLRAIRSPSRDKSIMIVRQYLSWKIAKHTEASLPEIGKFMHRDHTTVIHNIRRINARMGENVRSLGDGK